MVSVHGTSDYAFFGVSVSISADGMRRVAAGAQGGTRSQNAFGYVRISPWTRIGNDLLGAVSDDYAGHHVALSSDGSTVAMVKCTRILDRHGSRWR